MAEIISSYDLQKHAVQALGLAQTWGVSEAEASYKIRDSIRVKNENSPGLVSIEITGIEHGLAVRILNDLCTNACTMNLTVSVKGSPAQQVKIEIIQTPN